MTIHHKISLSDKYDLSEGRALINGSQALVRLPLLQVELDRKSGLNTAGFISGYRGSPLGGVDAALWQEGSRLKENGIVFQPGVNEDLAMTAVWGTQLLATIPDPQYDGVFSYWYGKGPGVDRSGDPMKHGNYQGTHRNGGVLLVYGDDHPGKSSTVSHQSEQALAANMVPSLYPANVEEILSFGLLGWALSRYSGLWCGLKIVNETAEQTTTVDLTTPEIVVPEREETPPNSVNIDSRMLIYPPVKAEDYVHTYRLPLLHKFVRANDIDKLIVDAPKRKLGIVVSGKAYMDLLQAIQELGLSLDNLADMGVSIYKVGLIWPIEPEDMKEFAKGHETLFFIEEKKAFVEAQARDLLYDEAERPTVVGKKNQGGTPLFSTSFNLDANQIIAALIDQFKHHGLLTNDIQAKFDASNASVAQLAPSQPQPGSMRVPYFCSGCPHSTSTKLPEGSMAMAGIGCHAMVALAKPESTLSPSHMGGEGAQWAGLSHFTGTQHMFQNLGDGTYFHSGLMCIRNSVASGSNITYKLLYNDAVAMTGGQPIDGPISVHSMIDQVLAEGVSKLVLVSDDITKYQTGQQTLPKGVELRHRDDMNTIQQELREVTGTTVILYEQTCAAEKRRRRKRGLMPDPAKRLFINPEVCEGCGDCSVQSTCVSLSPRETPYGLKRSIDQSSCNKDYSCVKGFCPSFVTVLGGDVRKPQAASLDDNLFTNLPSTTLPAIEGAWGIMVSGIGGTGVITVSAILAMAAHVDGKRASTFDMTGLSQKNGAVYSHLKIAETDEALGAQKMSRGEANLALTFDLVAGVSLEPFSTLSKKTIVVGNTSIQETVAFQFNALARVQATAMEDRLKAATQDAPDYFINATSVATALMGNSIAANMFMVGYAWQKGTIPLSIESIIEAIKLNGTAVDFNLKALSLGRLYASEPEKLDAFLPKETKLKPTAVLSFKEAREQGLKRLTAYQDEAYAQQFASFVDSVAKREAELVPGSDLLAKTVATSLAHLMAIKDEWEVARLYADPAFKKELELQFEGDYKLRFNLAPPILAKRDPKTGHLKKREFGPWVFSAFKLMAKMKGLRGGAFDIFGYTDERKMERRLIVEYKELVETLLTKLSPDNLEQVIAIAKLAFDIRGYGHVKEAKVEQVKAKEAELLSQLSA